MVDPSMIYEVPIIPPPFDWIMLIKLALIIPVYLGIMWIIGKMQHMSKDLGNGQIITKPVKLKNVAAMQKQGWVEGTVRDKKEKPTKESDILYKIAEVSELLDKCRSTGVVDNIVYTMLAEVDTELAEAAKGNPKLDGKVVETLDKYIMYSLLPELSDEKQREILIMLGKTDEEGGGPDKIKEYIDGVKEREVMAYKAGDTVTGLPSPQKRRGGPPTSLNDFPDYLAFGTLDKESVKARKDRVFAEYRAGGNIVFRVDWGKDGCQLESLFEGKELSTSYGLHLEEAFMQYMLSIVTKEDPHFTRIAYEATSGKNVYLAFPTGEKLVIYPAGFIFMLRQPIVESNHEAWENFKCKFDSNDELSPLKLEDELPGTIIRLSGRRDISIEGIVLVDFSCVLINLVEAVQVIWESGIIPPQKEYRLAVMDAHHSMTNTISIYPGDSERDVLAFTVLPIDQGSPDLKKSIAAFTEGSLQFLKSHADASSDIFQDRLSGKQWFKKGANSKQSEEKKELVYGEVSNFGLVFINKEEAQHFAYLHATIWEAQSAGITWGEFKDRFPEVFQEIIQYLEDIGWTNFDEWLEEERDSYRWSSESEAKEIYKENYSLNDRIPLMEFPFEIRGSLIDIMDDWLSAGPMRKMTGFIPLDIQGRYGEIEGTMHDGEFLRFKTEDEEKLVGDLEKYGYVCIRDDDLVARACGYV